MGTLFFKPPLGSTLNAAHWLSPSIAADWLFNEGSGTSAADLSPHANTGTLGTGVTWQASGRVGVSLQFPGTTAGHVSVVNNASLDLSAAVSIEAWFKCPVSLPSGGGCIVSKVGTSNQGGYAVFISGGAYPLGRLQFTTFIGGTAGDLLTPAAYNDNQWHHVVCVYDGTQKLIYVDGALAASAAYSGSLNTNTDALYIGGNVWTALPLPWPNGGQIDTISIFDRALTASEAQTLFLNAFCDVCYLGGFGTYSDPYTLTGSQIFSLCQPMAALAARVHRKATRQLNLIELWYRDTSNGSWYLFPIQPADSEQNHPVLTRQYRQPATLACTFYDNQGLLFPENLESPYNYNQAANFDALLDEARKILLRVGVFCYANLAAFVVPTSTLAPSSGSLASLTDGILGGPTEAVPPFVPFAPTSAAPFDIVVDIGTQEAIRHAVIRFATETSAAVTLPASVTLSTSPDNITWTALPTRPVGGALGDWDDDYVGRVVEVVFTDIEREARYIKFTITPVGAQTIEIDELAVYGGEAGSYLGANRFVGYLGDQIDAPATGKITVTATDVLKKLADNNETRITGLFGNVDLADIAYSLLTGATYWQGTGTAYDAPFTADEIGWTSGSNYTTLNMPEWQGQSNNHLGYQYELWNMVGWQLYADGNGVLQAQEPPYTQKLPDRALINAADGNQDVRNCIRHRTGKEMRNTVEVSSGKITTGGAGSTLLYEPNSVARYGRRRTVITDPIALSAQLQNKLCAYILRDYAWKLQTLEAEIAPDFDTKPKSIHGIRAQARPNLRCGKANTTPGTRRKQEIWALDSIEEHFTVGEWWGLTRYIPYVSAALAPPVVTALTSPTSTSVTLTWANDTDVGLAAFNVYYSSVGEYGPFTQAASGLAAGTTSDTITGLSAGQTYWVYVTAVDTQGRESYPSRIVSVLAGGSASNISGWTVTDLAASFGSVSGIDAQGLYTYSFNLTWTSPPVGTVGDPDPKNTGFKHMSLNFALGALPANPSDPAGIGWSHSPGDTWHGDRIPPTLSWDGVTPGALTWLSRWRIPTHLASGTKVYFRMDTTWTTDGWRDTFVSNFCFATVP